MAANAPWPTSLRRWLGRDICRVPESLTRPLPSRGCWYQGEVSAPRHERSTPNHHRRRSNQSPQNCNKRPLSPQRGHHSGRAGSSRHPPRPGSSVAGVGWLVAPIRRALPTPSFTFREVLMAGRSHPQNPNHSERPSSTLLRSFSCERCMTRSDQRVRAAMRLRKAVRAIGALPACPRTPEPDARNLAEWFRPRRIQDDAKA